MSGPAPPTVQKKFKNTCGFLVGNKFIVFSNCAFLHPPEVNQVPPSTSSVMLTTTAPNTITAPATGQNTPPDAKSEIEINSGTSPANQITKELSDLTSKIVKLEQNLSLLADKMANMDTKIKFIEESTKKIDNMDTKINQVDEAIKQFDSMDTRTKLIEEVTKKIANMETKVTMLEERVDFDVLSSDRRISKLWEDLGKEEYSASQFKDETNKRLMELENKLTSAAPRQRDSNP